MRRATELYGRAAQKHARIGCQLSTYLWMNGKAVLSAKLRYTAEGHTMLFLPRDSGSACDMLLAAKRLFVAGFWKETWAGLAGRRKSSYSTSHQGAMHAHRVSHEEERRILVCARIRKSRSFFIYHPATRPDEEKNVSTSRLAKCICLL